MRMPLAGRRFTVDQYDQMGRAGVFHEDDRVELVALLALRADAYRRAHAQPEDLLLVIEVADASLEHDRDVKVPLVVPLSAVRRGGQGVRTVRRTQKNRLANPQVTWLTRPCLVHWNPTWVRRGYNGRPILFLVRCV